MRRIASVLFRSCGHHLEIGPLAHVEALEPESLIWCVLIGIRHAKAKADAELAKQASDFADRNSSASNSRLFNFSSHCFNRNSAAVYVCEVDEIDSIV